MNSKGLTLLELLIGISVAAVAGTILVSMLVQSNRLFSQQGANVSHGLSLNNSLAEITSLTKEASSIASQYPPSGTPEYTSSASILILKLPSINSSGGIIDNVFDYSVISADAQKPYLLKKMVYPSASSNRKSEKKVLSTNLSSLTIYYFNNAGQPTSPAAASRINVTVSLLEKIGLTDKVSSASSDINLKNFNQ